MNLFTFLLACSPDNYIAPVQKELAVSPSLLEVEGVNVGDSKEFTLQLDNLAGGEISIRNVNLLPVDGDGFRVQSWDEFIPTGGAGVATLVFEPTAEGYQRALVEVTSDAKVDLLEVQVRGFAGVPELRSWPALLDFGFVPPGETRELDLTLFGAGSGTVSVEEWTFGDPAFSVVSDPVRVPSGEELGVTVRFTPVSEEAVDSSLVIVSNAGTHAISIYGNSCSIPGRDDDNDGYTVCAGDCDGENASVYPGAVELLDGLDNNCDERIDEHTAAYDDDGDLETENEGDCDDSDPSIHTGVTELPDFMDNDCDGRVDEGTDRGDDDGDGYTEEGGDCDDSDPSIHPAAIEVLGDGQDNDCDDVSE